MNKYGYTGNKTKNYFTAYLQKCIRWKRKNYLQKKEKISNMEKLLEENGLFHYSVTIEEILEIDQREILLLREWSRDYPEWNELSDKKLIHLLMLLSEDERRIIYQHVFEEQTFCEIAHLSRLPEAKVKNIYFYAIRKIRKGMGGEL